MARRTKAEAEATRESILDAAIASFLEKGVSSTTLEQIARRAGVTRGAVYWHFQDKNDVFTALLDRVRLPMYELVETLRREHGSGDPLTLIQRISCHALQRLQEDEEAQRIYAILFSRCEFVSGVNPAVEEQTRLDDESLAELTADLEQARERGLLREGVTPEVAALSLLTFMKGILVFWLREPSRFDLRVEGRQMLDVFFAGLRQPEPGVNP